MKHADFVNYVSEQSQFGIYTTQDSTETIDPLYSLISLAHFTQITEMSEPVTRTPAEHKAIRLQLLALLESFSSEIPDVVNP